MLISEIVALLTLIGFFLAVSASLANHPGNELEDAAQLPFLEEPDSFDA
ncbi:hypothetical protein [Halopseudomonas sabulinigri]|uniref:Uncharacterized protein n=1 Tax=Halopseudomonas sabulinigri TaxID=472181 RepID=A0A1H1XUP2_9GAMM|nr:hypothetical protein [Halopseudomonas sabulinigri]SDT12988.1 hypothetical protein SAMN05216271_3678 [Halopseudomonas sabulinigri]